MGGGGTLNANVLSNTFRNTGGASGRAFEMDLNQVGSVANLHLNGNDADGMDADYFLDENAGDFNIQDLATVQTRNTGTITFDPNMAAFDNINGPVPMP